MKFKLLYIFFLALAAPHLAFSQGMYTLFGQNRVQYGKFEWSFVRSENFDAYFYSGGRELSQFAARTAENELNDVERIIDHRLSGRVEIICYNSLSDYKQANFGLTDQPQNTGGYSQVTGNKMFIYFNGDHGHFEKQIRAGLALVLVNELLFGGNIQERIQNAALLNLPDWFMFGLTGHIGNRWNVDHDNKLKDLIVSRKVKKLNRLIQIDPTLAGLSFWRYLTDKYGEEVIANMIYITRLSRNYESALLYITGQSMKQVSKEWLAYYKEQYNKEDEQRSIPNDYFKIRKRFQPYIQEEMKVSSKGNNIAYTTNKYGKYKVWLMNTQTGKTKKLLRGGLKYHQKEIDYSFPMLAWHTGGEKLAYVYEKKGKLYITVNDLVTKKKETIQFLKFDKITAFDFSDNERTLVLSAIRKGQSDLYIYDIQTRRERQLTNDIHDDMYPRFVDGSSKIIFSSNRGTDSLNAPSGPVIQPDNNFDVYIYDFENPSTRLKRLTYTPYINEIKPIEYSNDYYAYITDYNGIKNRYVAKIESEYDFTELNVIYTDDERTPDTLFFDELKELGNEFNYEGRTIIIDSNVARIDTIVHNKDIVTTYPVTNYKRGVLSHDASRQTQMLYEVILDKNRYSIRYSPVSKNIVSDAKKTETYPTMTRLKSGYATKPFSSGKMVYSDRRFRTKKGEDKKPVAIEEKKEVYEYFFVNDFTPKTLKKEDIKVNVPEGTKQAKSVKSFKLNAPRFYDITFFPDHFVAQLDNSVINTYYQPITPSGDNLFNPGLNGMFNLGLMDLFEDYRLLGGFRVALDFSGIDYFLAYEVLKKRLDHKVSFYRQVRDGNAAGGRVKSSSHELRYQIKYPLNPVMSFRFSVFGRMDRDVYKAVNRQTTEMPDNLTYWGGGKAEFVFDNTIPKGLNLYNGTRFKIFYDRYENIQNREVQLNAIGFDFRHYQKLHRQLIACFRVSYNTSFGFAKVKYVLGGVDNWLFPQYDNSNNSLGTENYAFQALATNMRGFQQNIRNGNSFAVMNNEIRFPIFTYLLNRPIRSEFISNFQVVPFFDVGTAWIGNNPYSEDNTFNQKIVEEKYWRATIVNVREPIVAGYGGGLRTKLFGYFLRFDVAWGIQDYEVIKKPVYYLSTSVDF